MIRVAVEVREGSVTRRTQITARSIKRALKIAGAGRPDLKVRLLSFFVPTEPGVREAACGRPSEEYRRFRSHQDPGYG